MLATYSIRNCSLTAPSEAGGPEGHGFPQLERHQEDQGLPCNLLGRLDRLEEMVASEAYELCRRMRAVARAKISVPKAGKLPEAKAQAFTSVVASLLRA